MQTPFHPPPHLQRGENVKTWKTQKHSQKSLLPIYNKILFTLFNCAISFTLYQNVLKINNITQKKIVRRKRLDLTSI